jgi:Family of unknown function (DUF6461)
MYVGGMDAHSEQPGADDWGWVTADGGPLAELGCLLFVRGATGEQLLEAFGVTGAKMLPWERRWVDMVDDLDGCVRAGRCGEWAFVVEEGTLSMALGEVDLLQPLSAGTELVLVSYVGVKVLGRFDYYADGQWMTCFEPGMAGDRGGHAPDRLLAQMYQAGLDVEGDADYDPGFDATVGALHTVTLAFGIRLPEQVAHGTLLTGYVKAV